MSGFHRVEDRIVALDADNPVAIFVNKNCAGHVGLAYWAPNGSPAPDDQTRIIHTYEIHLLDDERLKHCIIDLDRRKPQMLIAPLGLTAAEDLFDRRVALVAQLDRLGASLGKGIPYGPAWLEAKGRFNEVGEYEPGAGSLTCATFVNEVLASVGIKVIMVEEWPTGTPKNIAWKHKVIEKLRARPGGTEEADHRNKMLLSVAQAVKDEDVRHLLPTEMAYAGSLPLSQWDVEHNVAQGGSTALIHQYCSVFACEGECDSE